MRRSFGVSLALVCSAVPLRASAHDVDLTSIARIFLDQLGSGRYALTVVDSRVPPITVRSGVLPEGCEPVSSEVGEARGVEGLVFACPRELTFDDDVSLPWSLAGVVVLARWQDGTEASAFFRGNGRTVDVSLADLRAGPGSLRRLAGRYFELGTKHILLGIDHLLFVTGLLLLVHGLAPLIKTVTAFTLAHSLTLALAVLGYVPVDRAPVEAAIALSIILLAREIVTRERGVESLVHRMPWLVAFIFGLLHGLGFAGALREIGLRQADVPFALLSFNLGVEAGQVSFVVVVLAVASVVRRPARASIPRLEPVLGYALGALSTLWLLDRLPALLGPP